MTAGNVNIICVPYNYLSLPSLDMAVLKACLTQKGIDSKVHHMDIAYALHIGGDTYLDLRDSLLGDAIFSAILFPDNQDRVKAALSKSGVEDGLLDDLVKKTENFLEDYLESKSFEFAPNSVAIFHLYSAQLFPALCISKKIYERFGAYCAVFATPFHAPLLQRSMADCHVAMRVALIARGAQAPLLANTAGYALSRCACALTRRLQYG